jgi:drug/metabolite transporter (DMT)-like permease
MKQKSWLPIYLILGLVWGSSFVFIKLGLEFLSPVGVAFGRCALGAMVLLLIVKIRGIKLPTEPKTWFILWVVSLLLNVFPGFLFAYAQQEVTTVLAGIINSFTPLATIVFIFIFFRSEKIQNQQILGLVVGGVGVIVVLGIWNGVGTGSGDGVLALFAAITCYGLAFPIIKKHLLPLKLTAEALAAGQVTAGALTLLPFYLMDGVASTEYRVGPVLAVMALGIFGTGFAYIWNFQIVERAGSSVASSVTYLTPVVAVFIGWIFLNENITWHEPVGGAIVVLGAAISQGRFSKKVAEKSA